MVRNILLSLLFVVAIVGCSDDEPPLKQYQLSIIVSPDKSGSVSPSEGEFTDGAPIELTGTPTNYYKFKEWKGDVTGTTNPITVLMNSNKSISAVFELKENFTYVPDDSFEQKLIDLGYDDVLDDHVKTINIKNVVELDVEYLNIKDLTGIKGFESLTILRCKGNELTSLDLSNNTYLETLSCRYNQLTSLDVSNSTSLKSLGCSSNQLKNLNVRNNTLLENLWCDRNKLTSLDVRNNTSLKYLTFGINQLTSLDLSNNTSLEKLNCHNNELTSLDVSKNTSLERLSCDVNKLTSLDVSYNTLLWELKCNYNWLTCIKVNESQFINRISNWITDDTSLWSLDCD